MLISLMSKSKGYPYKTLYWEIRPELGHGKYDLYGVAELTLDNRKEIDLFEQKEYAYIYVDKATDLIRYGTYFTDHEAEFQKLKK